MKYIDENILFWLRNAKYYFKKGNYDESIDYCMKIYESEPDHCHHQLKSRPFSAIKTRPQINSQKHATSLFSSKIFFPYDLLGNSLTITPSLPHIIHLPRSLFSSLL